VGVPLLIVVGTSLLFAIALVVFFVTLIRSSRASRRRAWDQRPLAGESVDSDARPVDANLEGLEVAVSEDAASASLLTPLRTGAWHPPAEPAPLGSLAAASLDGRIADYQPAPDVVDPAFSVPVYASWQVEHDAQEVLPPSPDNALTEESDAALDAEIAALLPKPPRESQASSGVPMPIVEPIAREEPISPPVVAMAEPVVDIWSPPDALPKPVPVPEPPPAPVPEPPPAPVPEPAPVPAPAIEAETGPSAGAMPAPETASEPDPLEETVFWAGMLAAQSVEQPRATRLVPPAAPRPEVRVSVPSAREPEVLAPAVAVSESPTPARPRVRVHVAAVDEGSIQDARPQGGGVVPVARSVQPDRRLVNPRLEMAAPVEMWFGEARVGVKAGSATYDRFRKYADVLLTELKDSKRAAH
jgi:hypothetical protein